MCSYCNICKNLNCLLRVVVKNCSLKAYCHTVVTRVFVIVKFYIVKTIKIK